MYRVSEKKVAPLGFSRIFFQYGWEFLVQFYTPIIYVWDWTTLDYKILLPRDALSIVQIAVLRSHVVRLSVCPSVCL